MTFVFFSDLFDILFVFSFQTFKLSAGIFDLVGDGTTFIAGCIELISFLFDLLLFAGSDRLGLFIIQIFKFLQRLGMHGVCFSQISFQAFDLFFIFAFEFISFRDQSVAFFVS